jgi:hypothetical protein
MHYIETSLYEKSSGYKELFLELERSMKILSDRLYNEYRFGIKSQCNRYLFDSLVDYYDILKTKSYCDYCLKDYPISQISSQIHKLTNKIR